MRFIRESLLNKAIFFFGLLVVLLMVSAIYLLRQSIESVSLLVVLGVMVGLLMIIFIGFLWDIAIPMTRIQQQINHLFSGQTYSRLEPKTIDEIGTFAHFFNEITADLEKVSLRLKEGQRMSSELNVAAQIQADVLPKSIPAIPGISVVAKTKAAAEIGGDVFDFMKPKGANQTYFYIGDVTGHGVPSGMVMMMANTLIQAAVHSGMSSTRDILVKTNDLLFPRISSRLFMTSVLLRWDEASEKLFYSGAGHEHILIFRGKDESVEAIRSGGIALGMIPDNSKIIAEKEIPVTVGDTLVLYSDGITEAKNTAGEMYTLERLTQSLHRHGFRPNAENIFDNLTADFSRFVGQYVQADDITMIVMKFVGKQAEVTPVKLSVGAEEVKKSPSKEWGWN